MNKSYALCMGTNYTGSAYALQGCENDALDWVDFFGKAGATVRPLIGRDATRANMLGSMHSTIKQAKFGDKVYITGSFHGTHVLDTSGDEPDGREEAVCPDDFQRAGLIMDDEIDAICSLASRGVGIYFFADWCHSGSANRFMGSEPPFYRKERFLRPTYVSELIGKTSRFTDGQIDFYERQFPARQLYANRSSLISGCDDPEYSYDTEFNGRPNGAFSRMAIDTWRKGMSLKAWFNAIREELPTLYLPQSPQVSPQSKYRLYSKAVV